MFETNEPSLYDMRIKLVMQYITKLCSNTSNTAYGCVISPMFFDHYDKKTMAIPTRGLRMKPHIASA